VADGFAVRPELLAAPADSFAEVADALSSAVDRARADLASLGDVCGDDEQGRAFAARYDPVAADGLAAIGRSAGTVGSFGTGLRAVVEQYAAGDDGVAGGFGGGDRS
jgi:hypothetical protein